MKTDMIINLQGDPMALKDLEVFQTQKDLEAASLTVGAQKYRDDQDFKERREGADRRDDSRQVIKGALPMVSKEIVVWIDKASQAAGRAPGGLAAIKMMDPDVLALIGLQCTFQALTKGKTEASVQVSIGYMVQTELEAKAIANKDPKAAKAFQKLATKETSQARNAKRHDKLAERLDVSLGWDDEKRIRVGMPILNAVLVGAPEIFERTLGGHDGRQNMVTLTDAAMGYMAELTEAAAWLRPRYMPMVVPPRPWTHFDTGAYYDPALAKTVPMIRTRSAEQKKLVKAAIKDGSMQEVLDGLNHIQATPFAIDTRTLPWIKWAKEEGRKVSKSFPLSLLPELPAKLDDAAWAEAAPEVRAALSRNRKKVRDIRLAAAVDGGVFASDIETAEFLAEHEAFWLPCSLDFRGRVYAVPHFNFQRSDHVKALFLFAEGKPMGPNGGDWLMIHLANCGDFGKVSKRPFEERIQWVQDNEAAIIATAQDPEGQYDWWSTADKPFTFLQACFEYRDWWMTFKSEDFVSRIGIALDGSCSGLQHYSAMTRSAEEGYHVNLTYREEPGDIYMVVADAARPVIELASKGGDLYATTILANGFGRSDVKRNVMTYFYGSAAFGMRDQQMEDKMRPLADKVALGELKAHPYSLLTERKVFEGRGKNKVQVGSRMEQDGGFGCANALGKFVFEAVTDVAPKADEAATWFQSVATLLAHESHPVIWRTPTGLPVVHKYSEYESKQVNLWLYDRKVPVLDACNMDQVDEEGRVFVRVRAVLRTNPTKRIDKHKARSAVSPNVVHSLDASHLIRTVVTAADQDVRAFMLIHDSFATHAGETDRFFTIIRKAFVDTYSDYCPFKAVDDYARSVLDEAQAAKLPAIPAKGTLDLEDVMHSLYAFA